MGPELVTVNAGGMQFTAFRLMQVRAALDHAARGFELVVAAEAGAKATFWQLAPGTALDITANGDLLSRGYVDRYQPIMSKKSREVKIAGRSKAQDFVDCAAIDPAGTGYFKARTVLSIAQALDQFGIGVVLGASASQLDTLIASYQITPGETAHAAIEKICRSVGVTLAGQADGSIAIAKAGTTRAVSGALIEGVNIIEGSADLDWSHRHSEVTVLASARAARTGARPCRVFAEVDRRRRNRFRPAVIVADDETGDDDPQAEADYRIAREAGESLKAAVQTQGFRDDAGVLWTPGWTVWTESPFLGLAQPMLISGVTYLSSRESGAVSYLDLVDPRAFGGKAGKGGSAKDPGTRMRRGSSRDNSHDVGGKMDIEAVRKDVRKLFDDDAPESLKQESFVNIVAMVIVDFHRVADALEKIAAAD